MGHLNIEKIVKSCSVVVCNVWTRSIFSNSSYNFVSQTAAKKDDLGRRTDNSLGSHLHYKTEHKNEQQPSSFHGTAARTKSDTSASNANMIQLWHCI